MSTLVNLLLKVLKSRSSFGVKLVVGLVVVGLMALALLADKPGDLTSFLPASTTLRLTLTPTPLPLPSPAVNGASTSAASAALVTKIVDGDTIEVNLAGELKKVRLIGVDTPETVDPRKAIQCFGQEASQYTKQLLDGKTITLEKDVSETDRYGRLLRYVYLEGVFVNQQLVTEGYAYARSYPPDVKYQAQFRAAEQQAREQKRGMWGDGVCD